MDIYIRLTLQRYYFHQDSPLHDIYDIEDGPIIFAMIRNLFPNAKNVKIGGTALSYFFFKVH